MAAQPDDPAVRERLAALFEAVERQPWSHDFFALLRRIDALHPGTPRLGSALRPGAEPLRLGQDAEMDFAPAAVMSFQPSAESRPPRLGVRFFGLFGPMGPLPLHLTEYARDRQRNHADATLVRFADIFHHRALLLFYRAWSQSQPVVQADRASDDRFAAWVGAIAGLAPAMQRADSIPDLAKRYLAGHLSNATRHPESMRKLLVEYFGVPIRIESHVGHWMNLRREDRSRLGSAGARRSAPLGVSSVAGSKVWDRQYKLRLHIGPLSLAQYRRFLPGQRSLIELRDWMRHLLGFEMMWDLRLELQSHDVPRLGLSQRAATAQPLGYSAWLGRKAAHAHRNDLRLTPARIAAAAQASLTNGDSHD